MARFLHFTSFKDYEESCLDGNDDIKRFRSLSRAKKIREISDVDETIHNANYDTNYDDELD